MKMSAFPCLTLLFALALFAALLHGRTSAQDAPPPPASVTLSSDEVREIQTALADAQAKTADAVARADRAVLAAAKLEQLNMELQQTVRAAAGDGVRVQSDEAAMERKIIALETWDHIWRNAALIEALVIAAMLFWMNRRTALAAL